MQNIQYKKLLTKGYKVLNVFNIYLDKNNEMSNSTNIYILFINENHFNYLELINNDKKMKYLIKQLLIVFKII